jgi:predicted SAM-dependent methyltransferase
MRWTDLGLAGEIQFEVASALGRLAGRSAPKKNGYVNLGCGPHYCDGYCNADFFRFATVRRVLGRPVRAVDWELDLRFPFKCPDRFYSGVFCEHVLEHLTPAESLRLLGELNRIVVPGGVVRVSVPSIEAALERYWSAPPQSRAAEIAQLACKHGHRNVFDSASLCAYLEQAGFTDVRACSFGTGSDPMVVLDQDRRRLESIYVEGLAKGQ